MALLNNFVSALALELTLLVTLDSIELLNKCAQRVFSLETTHYYIREERERELNTDHRSIPTELTN